MSHRHLLVLSFVFITGCKTAQLTSKAEKKPFLVQQARSIPRGTRFSVELVKPPLAPLHVGQRIQGRLTHALVDLNEGNFIPPGALVFGVVTKTFPQQSFQISFESLTYSGTTMRLRAKVVPVPVSENASVGRLELELEEPLPLQPAMKG